MESYEEDGSYGEDKGAGVGMGTGGDVLEDTGGCVIRGEVVLLVLRVFTCLLCFMLPVCGTLSCCVLAGYLIFLASMLVPILLVWIWSL